MCLLWQFLGLSILLILAIKKITVAVVSWCPGSMLVQDSEVSCIVTCRLVECCFLQYQ